MYNKALEYGIKACDTMMRKFAGADLPPKGYFHYHQGVFLSGVMNMHSVCGNEKYFDYVKSWIDSIVLDKSVIRQYFKGTLDDHMSTILLYPLFEKTGEEKYEWAIKQLTYEIKNWVISDLGGYWHKEGQLDQMWLDGLYMVGPMQMMFAKKYGDKQLYKQAVHQAYLMYENMKDEKTGLLYHAWDCSRTAKWANEKTGLAPEIWGRAMGWYVVALLDMMEYMDADSEEYKRFAEIEKEVLGAVFAVRDEKAKLWYQVLNKGDKESNWHEASCSCLFVYAAAKAARMGVVSVDMLERAIESFDAIIDKFVEIKDGDLLLSGVCIGTGVLDYQGYIERPTSTNDLHGMGAFLLMCAELAR